MANTLAGVKIGNQFELVYSYESLNFGTFDYYQVVMLIFYSIVVVSQMFYILRLTLDVTYLNVPYF